MDCANQFPVRIGTKTKYLGYYQVRCDNGLKLYSFIHFQVETAERVIKPL